MIALQYVFLRNLSTVIALQYNFLRIKKGLFCAGKVLFCL